MTSIKKSLSSVELWVIQAYTWKKDFFFISMLILIMIPFSLLILVLLPYSILILNTSPHFLTWKQILGNEISIHAKNIFFNTIFYNGIPVDIQSKYFALFLIFVAFFYGLINFLSDYYLRHLGEKLALDLRLKVFKKFLNLNYELANDIDSGYISAMVGEDIREAQQTFTRLISSLLKDGLSSIIFILWLIFLDFKMFMLFSSVLIPAGVVLRVTSKKLKKLSKEGIKAESDLLTSIFERIQGWQTIKVYKSIKYEIKTFNSINDKIYHIWKRATRASALGTPVVEWLGIIAATFVIIAALRRIAINEMNSNILTSFIVTIGFLSDKINRMTNQLNTTKKGTECLKKVIEFLSSKDYPEKKIILNLDSNETKKLEDIKCFEVENLSIVDNKMKILAEGIKFKAEKSDIVVIVGASGIGKTTLLKTLLGLQPKNVGSIKLDGKELTQEDYLKISKRIGFVPQDPFLFFGTIFENIIYPQKCLYDFSHNRLNLDNEKYLLDAEKSLDSVNLKKNLNSYINTLSGGEKQRLMFARLFFHQPELIFIDEGTSALDSINELNILNYIKNNLKDSIVFIVAHKPSVLKFATKIIDLSKYKIY